MPRAFFAAPAEREVYVEIPEEYWNTIEGIKPEPGSMIGHLKKSLYGTRDAARNWQAHVIATMTELGYETAKYNRCMFKKGHVGVIVHGVYVRQWREHQE